MISIGLSIVCPKNKVIINGIQYPFRLKKSLKHELIIQSSNKDKPVLQIILPTKKQLLGIDCINFNEMNLEQKILIESLMTLHK